MKNLFCEASDLTNEATVEALFVNRLLEYLGYKDQEISYKETISEIAVGKGSKKVLYRPDYVLKTNKVPTIVIDAKSPKEDILDWTSQCSSYCLELNKEFDYNPVDFSDFSSNSDKLAELENFISRNASKKTANHLKEKLDDSDFLLDTISLDELKTKFQKLHKEIWQSEKKGPAAAFNELIKIFFVKIRKDRELHDKLGTPPKPKYKDVTFSLNWIATQTETQNPINDLLFKNLITELEKDIIAGKKKRFF